MDMRFTNQTVPAKSTVIKTLIIINVICFIPVLLGMIFHVEILSAIEFYYLGMAVLRENIPLRVDTGAVYQLVTSMFMHGGLTHFLFNMIALYSFGKPLEVRWGGRSFLLFYLVVGILANLLTAVIHIMTQNPTLIIGASGAVFGVLLAFASLYPDAKAMLFFVIPIKMKWLVLIFAIMELFFEMTNTLNGISHLGHLSGLLFAFIYLLVVFRINAVKKLFFPGKDDYIIY